jgi:hypothetical protein
MVSSNKKKPSASSQPNSAAIVTVSGSELDFYTNSNYLAFELPQFAAAQRQGKLGSNDIDDDLSEEEEEESEEEELESEEGEESDEEKTGRPSLSDIQVISNEIVFDAANNPTAKIVFKVKNSSGVELKAIDVRVEKK